MTNRTPPESAHDLIPLAAIDFHLLVVLAEGESYGYAIKKELAAASNGAIDPEIGSLYRVIARLTKSGMVVEAGKRAAGDGAHPGHPRRYYRITERGREVMGLEAARMRALLDTADAKNLITES
jgi:DNA-binding PadR family transcriptional regulator